MSFYPDDATVPTGLQTNVFLLRMLRATDVKLDCDAVMASQDDLLVRSSGRWPREGFTLAENLTDLEQHEREHHARTAFTYTVMNVTETRCLGCVYINPLRVMLERFPPTEPTEIDGMTPYVTFWVRPDEPGMDLDRLFAALRSWFAAEWAFPQVLFMANEHETRHLGTYEKAGLTRVLSLPRPEPSVTYHFYG